MLSKNTQPRQALPITNLVLSLLALTSTLISVILLPIPLQFSLYIERYVVFYAIYGLTLLTFLVEVLHVGVLSAMIKFGKNA